LSYPTKVFVPEVKLFDNLFDDYHKDSKDGLSREFDVVKNFKNLLEQKFKDQDGQPMYDGKMLQKFALSRTLFRMRAIGTVIQNQ
jgi:hypothetical protein